MSTDLLEDFKKRYFQFVEKALDEYRNAFILEVHNESYRGEFQAFICKVWEEALVKPNPGGSWDWKNYRVVWNRYPFRISIWNKDTNRTEIICRDFTLYPDIDCE